MSVRYDEEGTFISGDKPEEFFWKRLTITERDVGWMDSLLKISLHNEQTRRATTEQASVILRQIEVGIYCLHVEDNAVNLVGTID